MFEYLDVLFALLAGVIYTIIMIILGHSINEWVLNLILIMLIMLMLGRIFKSYIKHKVLVKKEDEVDEALEDLEETGTLEQMDNVSDDDVDYPDVENPMFDEDDE